MSNSDLLAVNTVRYVPPLHDKMSLNWRSELENKIPLIWKVMPSAAIWVLCNYGKKSMVLEMIQRPGLTELQNGEWLG